MTRAVPVCHRTIGPNDPRPCIGSRCAMWVPETLGDLHARESYPNTCAAAADDKMRTGFGRCADNFSADPWPDPAAEKETT